MVVAMGEPIFPELNMAYMIYLIVCIGALLGAIYGLVAFGYKSTFHCYNSGTMSIYRGANLFLSMPLGESHANEANLLLLFSRI